MALRPSIREPREIVLLWTGMLAGPLAWMAQLAMNYALTDWTCRSGHRWALDLTFAVTLTVTAAGALAAWTVRRPSPHDRPERVAARHMSLAWCGLGLSALFALAIAATMIPRLYLSPCTP
jgi:hypothetical protein